MKPRKNSTVGLNHPPERECHLIDVPIPPDYYVYHSVCCGEGEGEGEGEAKKKKEEKGKGEGTMDQEEGRREKETYLCYSWRCSLDW